VFSDLNQPIDVESIGWMFSLPSPRIQAFLHWLCHNVKASNDLTKCFDAHGCLFAHLIFFNLFLSWRTCCVHWVKSKWSLYGGIWIEKRQQSDQWYKFWSYNSGHAGDFNSQLFRDSLYTLQEEITALENEIASLTNRIDDLVFQRDTFAIRLQKMGERSSSLKQYHLKFDDPGLSTQLVARGSGGAAVTAATALNAQLNFSYVPTPPAAPWPLRGQAMSPPGGQLSLAPKNVVFAEMVRGEVALRNSVSFTKTALAVATRSTSANVFRHWDTIFNPSVV
jgi:hypothetical protein